MSQPIHAKGRRHSVTIDGSRLAYWVYGPNRDAPVIVAVHGFRGTHHGLEAIINHLPGYTVIVPDLPGFGESEPMKNRSHDIDGYAGLLEAFIPRVSGPDDRLILLGHSFGSIVAAALAAKTGAGTAAEPVAPERLILVNPIAARPQIVGRLASIIYFRIGGLLSEARARRYFSWPVAVNAMSLGLTKTRDRDVRDYVKHQHLEHFSKYGTRETLWQSFDASVTRSVGEFIADFTVPTLLIAGSRDAVAPLSSQYKMYARMHGPVELAVIEHVGHLTHYEKTAETAAFMRAFLED